MASIEDRIVRIQFDNASFERKIQSTLLSLAELDKALQFNTAKSGLNTLNTEMGKVNLASMAQAVDHISNRFNALGAVAFTVIQGITQASMQMLGDIAKAVTAPVFQGGLERALAIEQAQFMFRGLGIDVAQAMDSARNAVLGTAYGLGDAAKAAAQFAASGIAVGDDMTSALRGVAGAAAMTGTSFGEIAYIFSGIAGQNKVNSQDLMQFSTRGLNAAAAIAKAMGTTEQAVRDMVSNGELDFKTFAKYMDIAFGQHATKANETFKGSLANVKAAMARLGASFISPQLLNFRDIFNTLTPVIDNFTKTLKPVIDMFSFISSANWTRNLVNSIGNISFEGLQYSMPSIIDGMVNLFRIIENLGRIAKEAFKEIFPGSLTVKIIELSTWFKTFTQNLQITGSAASKIRSIFSGFFAALSIGWTIVKEGVAFLINLGKSIAAIFGPGVVGGFVKFGDALTNLQNVLVKQGGIKEFFDGLTKAIQKPLEYLQKLKDAVAQFFQGAKAGVEGAGGTFFENLMTRLEGFANLYIQIVKDIVDAGGRLVAGVSDAFSKVAGFIDKATQGLQNWLKDLWADLAAGISTNDFDAVLDALNTAFLGGIALLIGKWMKGGLNFTGNFNFFPVDMMNKIGGAFQELTNTLKAMQTEVKANALMKIAQAIGLLTASVLVLSTINSENLTKALTAMAVGFGQLVGVFAAIEKLSVGPKGAINFTAISTGMILLASGMFVLSLAVKVLSTLDWDGLVKGLAGVLVLLAGMAIISKPLGANSKGMISAGLGIQAMAVGLVIMATAVKILGSMSWENLVKGLAGVAIGLGAITLALRLMPPKLEMIQTGIAVLFIATSMAILGGAVAIFGSLDLISLGKGLLGMALSLGAVVLAMRLMPKDMGNSAGSLLMVSVAMIAIATAMKMIGGLSWENLAKGLVGIAVALGLLVGASLLMQNAIPGAGAMVLVASALLILAKAITMIGKLSIGQLVTSLIGLSVGMAILAAASTALSSATPAMLAFGAGLLVLGAAILFIGAGILLLAKGMEIIAKTGEAAAKALPDVLYALASALPKLMQGLAQGVVDMIEIFIKAAPVFAKAIGILLENILDALIKLVPKATILMGELIEALITLVYKYTEPLVQAGMHVIISFLKGISDNIEEIVTLVADIITKFLDAMAKETPRVVDSLVNLFTTFFLETARGLGEVAGTILLGAGQAFIEGFLDGADQQLNGSVWSFITSIPGKVVGWIGDALSWLWQKGVDALTGMWNGLVAGVTAVWNFFTGLPGRIIGFFVDAINWLLNAGGQILEGLKNGLVNGVGAVWDFISGIPDKVKGWFSDAINWLGEAGENIVRGLFNGITKIWGKVKEWVENAVDDLVHTITHPWEIFSPSHLMQRLGQNIMKGWLVGMQRGYKSVDNFISNLKAPDTMNKNLTDVVSKIASSLESLPEFQPTITPVLDLTRVSNQANQLGSILGSETLTPRVSLDYAKTISRDNKFVKGSLDYLKNPDSPSGVVFNQTINAPKQLSPEDIYKQTRNQITIAKEELSIP